MPYVSSSAGALYEAIRSPDPVVLPDQPTISPQLANLLTRLLHKDPDTRIKLDEVRTWECTTCKVLVVDEQTLGYSKVAGEVVLWKRGINRRNTTSRDLCQHVMSTDRPADRPAGQADLTLTAGEAQQNRFVGSH